MESVGQDIVRRDATLGNKIGRSVGQAAHDVNQEIADLLAQMLAPISIVTSDFLTGSINDGRQMFVCNLLYNGECLLHQRVAVVEDALHVKFYTTGTGLCQQTFQLARGFFHVGANDEQWRMVGGG